ncbi:MAG: hypothetical protein K2Y37_07645 [Pirellulales bacterium]|nr:hypothetical protein [Pirellulales bacterium]
MLNASNPTWPRQLRMLELSMALVAAWLLLGLTDGRAAEPVPRLEDNPFAAHNAYPWRFYGKDRFDKALASGLKHLEVDVTYDPARQAAVATHDAKPTGQEPELGKLLEPLWTKWGAAPDDGYTLIIDFKSSSPELVAALRKILEPQRALLSTLTKGSGTEFRPRKITVCLTGDGAAHRLFKEQTEAGSDYLAFSDDTGCPGSWRADASHYVPDKPAGFVRFVTLEKSNFMDAAGATGNDHVSLSRLQTVSTKARDGGYRLRIYTINPARRSDQPAAAANDARPDAKLIGEALSPGWDTHFWDLCLAARVQMIATDAYDVAAAHWKAYVEAAGRDR